MPARAGLARGELRRLEHVMQALDESGRERWRTGEFALHVVQLSPLPQRQRAAQGRAELVLSAHESRQAARLGRNAREPDEFFCCGILRGHRNGCLRPTYDLAAKPPKA